MRETCKQVISVLPSPLQRPHPPTPRNRTSQLTEGTFHYLASRSGVHFNGKLIISFTKQNSRGKNHKNFISEHKWITNDLPQHFKMKSKFRARQSKPIKTPSKQANVIQLVKDNSSSGGHRKRIIPGQRQRRPWIFFHPLPSRPFFSFLRWLVVIRVSGSQKFADC